MSCMEDSTLSTPQSASVSLYGFEVPVSVAAILILSDKVKI